MIHRNSISIISTVLLLLLIGSPLLQPYVSGQEDPDEWSFPPIYITYDGKFKNVSVEPGSNNTFSVSGKIHAIYQGRENDSKVFQIMMMVTGDILSEYRTPKIPISQDEPITNYTVLVTPSYGLQAELDAEIWIVAYVVHPDDPNQIDYFGRGQINLKVKQYGAFSVHRTIVTERVPVGEWRTVTLTIKNEGNGIDRFNITLISCPDEVDYVLDLRRITIERGGEGSVNIRIRQKTGFSSSNTMKIEVSSMYPGRYNSSIFLIQFVTKWSISDIETGFWLPIGGAVLILVLTVSIWFVVFKPEVSRRIVQRSMKKS